MRPCVATLRVEDDRIAWEGIDDRRSAWEAVVGRAAPTVTSPG